MHWWALILCLGIDIGTSAQAQELESAATEQGGWSGMAQLGAGYDTNANVSTRKQSFIGFILDPRFVKSESAFGELSFGLDHTAIFNPRSGLNSSLQLAHRANPDAPFADQSVASLGTEAVLIRGSARFTAGISAYAGWLDQREYEEGAHFDLGVSYQPGEAFDSALTVRTSRLSYAQDELRQLDIDRYLVGAKIMRLNLGAGSGNVAFSLLVGRDAPRRANSAFGNRRVGAQVSTNWTLFSRASLYAQASAVRVDYAGRFFDLGRNDDQYEAAIALEFTDWPAEHWSVTPQLRYERTFSDVSVFEYDRAEAALYVRRQF